MSNMSPLSHRTEAEINNIMLAIDAAPNAITVHDFDGNFLYANESTFKMHGFSQDEIKAINLRDLDTEESAALIEERMRLLKENGEASFEVTHLCKNGSHLPLEIYAKVTQWGDKPAILSIATDITERKQNRYKIISLGQKYKSLIEATNTAYIIMDELHHIIETNKAFIKLIGIKDINDIIGMTPDKWILPDSIDKYEEGIKLLDNNIPVHNLELGCINEQKKLVWISVEANTITNGQRRYFCIIRDISARKKSEIQFYIIEQKKKDRLRQNIMNIRGQLKKIIGSHNDH